MFCFILCCGVLFIQSCPTLCDPMDYSSPGSSVHGHSLGQNTGVGCHARLQGLFPTQGSIPGLMHCSRFFTIWATREAHYSLSSPENRARRHDVYMFVFEVECTFSEWRMRERGISVKEGEKSKTGLCVTKKLIAVQENWLMIGHVGWWSPAFLAPGNSFVEDNFSTDRGWGNGFRMIQIHLLCTLFLLLLHQLHIRSSGVRSQRLRSLPVAYFQNGCVESLLSWTVWFCCKERRGNQFICHFLSISCLISQSSPHGPLTPPCDPIRQSLEKAESVCVQEIKLKSWNHCGFF